MREWTKETSERVLQDVANKSAVDPEFRKLCLSDPKAAIAEVSDIQLPPNFKVRFVEPEGANVTMVLPDAVSEVEFSEADLELVSGGQLPGWFLYTPLPMMFAKFQPMPVV